MKQNEELQSIPELQQPKNILGKWAAFFIDRYKIVYLLLVAIVIVGVSAYFGLPRELNPEIVLPYGQVFVMYPGAAPEEVETLITDVLETKLEDIEDVKMLSSYSSSGASNVWLEFEQGVDMEKKMNEVREKVNSASLEFPEDAETPVVASLESNNSPIMIINLSGDYDLVTLKSIAEDIKLRLESDSDISEVLIIGGLEREIKIHVNPQKLAVYGISLDQIKNSIALANLNYPGGSATLDEKTYNIRTVGELKSVDALNDVIIAYQGAGPVRIKDIATVEDGYKEVDSYSRMSVGLDSNQPNMKTAVALSVKKKESADIIKTSGIVRDIIDNEKGTLYPSDLQVEISGDTAEFVRDSLGAVTSNALSGLFLVIIVLFLFIGLREAGIVSIVIPLAIMMTLYFLNLVDMTLNTITLFSMVLAVGMLVDNGIVIMENIDRLRGMGIDAKLAAEAGTNQIAPAIMASTLTTLAAFFPIALTPGIMGEFIRSIPITVMFALGSSFLLAITVTPALCSRLLAKQHEVTLATPKRRSQISKVLSVLLIIVLSLQAFKDDNSYGLLSFLFAALFGGLMFAKVYFGKKNKGHHPIIEAYGERLYKIVSKRSKRWTVIFVLILAFFTSLSLIPLGLLKVGMFSQTDYERLYVDINTPEGSTLEQTNEVVHKVEKVLFGYSEIKTFVSNVGITGADSFNSFNGASGGGTPNIARITIDLYKEEERSRTSMALAADLREHLKSISGAELTVIELEDGPPSGGAISVGLIGEDINTMAEVANHFQSVLDTIPGTRDTGTSLSSGGPELEISIDKEKASKFGLDELTISSTIRNTVSGINATTYRNNQDDIDVMIYSGMDDVHTKGDLESLYFYNHMGQAIRFNQIASFKETATSPTIRHEEGKRRVNITAETDADANTVEIMDQFKAKIADYKLPDGVSITYGGEIGDMQDSFTDMFMNMIIAAILVYLILAVQFNSLTQPLIVLFAVPLGLIGVMPGLFITGNSFGFLAFIGVVALVGIAVNDAIVLVDYINYLRRNGYELLDAVRETGKTRFMPVLATTITTAGGILPLTLKQAFFKQMGFALIFGLMMSTVLTLVAIPTLYTMLESFKINRMDKRKKKKMRKSAAENAATV